MEPGFYKCSECKHAWQRMEYKMAKNDPSICPQCNASADKQHIDEEAESRYYGPIASMILGDKKEGA